MTFKEAFLFYVEYIAKATQGDADYAFSLWELYFAWKQGHFGLGVVAFVFYLPPPMCLPRCLGVTSTPLDEVVTHDHDHGSC